MLCWWGKDKQPVTTYCDTMSTLSELKKSLLADGVIDAEEVKQLDALLYADGVIEKEEAEFMFELSDAVSGKDNAPEWEDLFVKVICSFLLEDEATPGEIDSEEAEWLYNKVKGDGQVDALERKLLATIKEKAKSFPAKLAELM